MSVLKLPAGLLTFVFFDMVGSTRRCRQLGTVRFAELLEDYHRAVGEQFDRCGGTIVQLEGDGGFGVLTSVAAIAGFVDGFHREAWRLGVEVRIGAHTAQAYVVPNGYVGEELHRAARIAASANSGQVILSTTTATMLPPGTVVRQLGDHVLKDFPGTTKLVQLGEIEFPALRGTLSSRLPVIATATVGRIEEVATIAALLRDDKGPRCVTITGTGGIGKTRVALESARASSDDFLDGVWWVSLAEIAGSSLVADNTARVIGVRTDPERTTLELIIDHLSGGRHLLVLDNAEHLLDGTANLVSALIERCPNVRILCTSRAPLRLEGERVISITTLQSDAAVALFRRGALDAGVETRAADDAIIGSICQRLDHLPLAIELAAARTPMLGLAVLDRKLASALSATLSTTRRGESERRRTMRATIDWTLELVKPSQLELLAELATFPGGARLEAVEELLDADLDDLEALVEQSLVYLSLDPDAVPRYRELSLVRERALDILDERRLAEPAWEKTANHWVTTAASASMPIYEDRDTERWLDKLSRERSNIRGALEWCRSRNALLHRRLANEMANYWFASLDLTDAREHLVPAASLPPDDTIDSLRARWAVSCLQWMSGDLPGARASALAAVSAAEKLESEWWRSAALYQLHNTCENDVDRVDVLTACLDAAQRAGNTRDHVAALCGLAARRPPDEALILVNDALALARRTGNVVPYCVLESAEVRFRLGDFTGSARFWLEGVSEATTPFHLVNGAVSLAEALTAFGQDALAIDLLRWAADRQRTVGFGIQHALAERELARLGVTLEPQSSAGQRDFGAIWSDIVSALTSLSAKVEPAS